MFKCKLCGIAVETVNCYVQHCRLHSNLPKPRFSCCFPECRKSSSTYCGLRKHISREHSSAKSVGVNEKFREIGVSLHCAVLSCNMICNDASGLIKHLHKHIKDGMPVMCPMKYCHKIYAIKSSFSGHLSRDHTHWTIEDLKGNISAGCKDQNLVHTVVEHNDSVTVDDTFDIPHPDGTSEECAPLPLKDQFTNNLSLFLVKLIAHHLIPESVVDLIARELQNINATNQQYLQQNVLLSLENSGASTDCITSVMNAVCDSDLIKSCLDEGGILHTSHKRSSYIQRQHHYVQPESIYVGINSKNKTRYAYYVPVKKSLLALLSDESVMQQCLRSRFEDSNIFSNFTDGSVYKKCILYGETTKKCLSLILYQDAFEIANPLGSAKRKYKVLGFYYVLGNLERHNRSTVDHIQLVMLTLEVDIEKVGQRLFRRLVDDLKSLETDGLEVSGHQFRVVVPVITGDNLGSHWLGGFTTSFSKGPHICRFCTLTKHEFDQGTFCASVKQLRTVDKYNLSLRQLANDNLKVHEGVKFDSIFNSLNSFHVCNPGLPPCVAHDLFEGIVSYDLPLYLKALMTDKNAAGQSKLSTAIVNRRLDRFTLLSSDASVKPPQIKSCLDKLSGSASQNWCLLRIIPLLIADLVDVTNVVYQLLLLLRSVCELVMAPRISIGQVAEMKVLIEDYLERRRDLFPNVPLRPKHHYMTHYAQLTMQFGPLVQLWTMRFENKHQYFKRCVRFSRNFVNVASLLANRHQLCQAYLSASPRFTNDIDVSHSNIVVESSIATEVKRVLSTAGVNPAEVFSAATIKGTVYSRGLVLPLKACHATKSFVFCEILLIIVRNVSCEMVVGCRNALFDYDTGCYNLEEPHEITIVTLECCLDFHPLPVYNINGQLTVILRHQVVDSE